MDVASVRHPSYVYPGVLGTPRRRRAGLYGEAATVLANNKPVKAVEIENDFDMFALKTENCIKYCIKE
jgi:hypothetical protein